MIQKLEGLKTTLWSGLAVSLIIVATLATQHYWVTKVNFIEQVLMGGFVVGILFSAQFSRSRFTLLIALCFGYYLLSKNVFTGLDFLNKYPQWLYLSTIFILAYLTLIKDRALISMHGIARLVGLGFCIALAKLWLMAMSWLQSYSIKNSLPYLNIELIIINFPLFIVALLVLFKSLRQPNLFVSSLLTTLIVGNLYFNDQISLPLSIMFSLLVLHYIIVVVIDSYYLAYRDELTHLPSRRALNQYALSLGRKYCVAMLDIDHFKKFNDNYGHDIGDQVLKLVAAKLAEVKSGGRVFRYGGEEFTAIFPRKTAAEALDELEKLRQSVADYNIVIRHPIRKTKKSRQNNQAESLKTVNVTISIGVATRQAKQSFEQTIKQADQALYKAKKKGRNQVCQ
ncbi:GGDEF domain-containing protein [Thalassotalea sp. SU-HH00458]|uniref:GGDEF domain-containing protein n=1 Tax=Thalassotalea sp. SU-HH00458 TaxID=3127657 RepID=UPI00310928E4